MYVLRGITLLEYLVFLWEGEDVDSDDAVPYIFVGAGGNPHLLTT